jgi:hypothetical protein
LSERARAEVTLSELIAPARRVALVGLAKNTGKTQTLTAILAELAAAGRTVGVTSIGRDGEAHDVIDARIAKPRIELRAGSLVASTDALLRASGLAHERLRRTGVRTPLGEVVIARLTETGALEVAGPSAAEDVREVGAAMLGLGAEQILIDGSIDRRAASSPAVSDGLVVATGAVLSEDLERVVAATVDAVELVRLPATALPSERAEIAALLNEHPEADAFEVKGALGERFLEGLLGARRERAGRELRVVASDPTAVFLGGRGPGWYGRQGIRIEARRTIELRAITVNPVAPQSHSFPSAELRARIETAIPDVPVLDVLDPSYPQPQRG